MYTLRESCSGEVYDGKTGGAIGNPWFCESFPLISVDIRVGIRRKEEMFVDQNKKTGASGSRF